MDIQEVLFEKAKTIGCRGWIPFDKGFIKTYSLKSERTVKAYDEVISEADFLDCIYFQGDKCLMAVFKICDHEKVIESLYRLFNFKATLPPYPVIYYLVYEDNLEERILSELQKPLFKKFVLSLLPLSKIEKFDVVSDWNNLS